MAWNQKRSPFPPAQEPTGNGHSSSTTPLHQAPRGRMPKLQFSPADSSPADKQLWGTQSARLPDTDSIHARMDGAKTDRGSYRFSKIDDRIGDSPRLSKIRAKTGSTRLSLPADWKKDVDRLRTAPLPGMGEADFHLSDFPTSRTRGSSTEKLGQLDNWPSTTSLGSKSWLSRLEAFVDNRMELVVQGDVEQEVLAYHECFAKFIEDFKTYKPVLSRVFHSYQKFIEFAQVSLRRVSELEFQMYTMQERTQEEVRRAHVDAEKKIKDMEKILAAAKKSEKLALVNLEKVTKELEVAKEEVGKEKEQRDKLEEINRAYCSGYKWVMKHVAKANEPSDLDAMETVTLIQKLERALADSKDSRFQMEYLQRTSEVVLAKTTLEEERRLFGEETERMQAELDNLRHSENAVSRQYRQAKTNAEALQEQVDGMRQQLEGMFLMHLGDGDNVPPLLRTSRPVINRQTSKDEALELTAQIFNEAVDRWNSGVYPQMEEVLEKVLTDFYHKHNTAEWTRNLIDTLEENREVGDFALVGGVLAEALGPHALLRRSTFFSDLADRLTALAYRMHLNSTEHLASNPAPSNPDSANNSTTNSLAPSQAASSPASNHPHPGESTPKPSEPAPDAFEEVVVEDMIAELPWVFRLKTPEHQEAIRNFLSKDAVRGQRVSIQRIRSGSPLGFEEELVELLQEQLVEEVRVYLADLRAAMVATAGKRKSRQKEPHIGVTELREAVLSLEPEKSDEDIAMVIWRGFSLVNYEEAYSIVVPDEENRDHAEDWGRTPSEPPDIPMEPIDRVLYRLSVANLLHRTEPEPLLMPPRPPTAVEESEVVSSTEEEAAAATAAAATAVSPLVAVESAAPVDVEQGRFKAIKAGLETQGSQPVPRWARKADLGWNKPFLNSLVQAYRAKTK